VTSMRLALAFLALAVPACAIAQGGASASTSAARPRLDSFSALASDRTAGSVGDVLTIVVYENTSASNSASTSTSKANKFGGKVTAGSGFNQSASLGLNGGSDNSGSTSRSGQMVTQLSVTVTSVLPNGDLRVEGEQDLTIAGEHSRIRLSGRVRAADIASGNTVMSYRLADAKIEYNGKGYVSRGAKPGIIARIFGALGLM